MTENIVIIGVDENGSSENNLSCLLQIFPFLETLKSSSKITVVIVKSSFTNEQVLIIKEGLADTGLGIKIVEAASKEEVSSYVQNGVLSNSTKSVKRAEKVEAIYFCTFSNNADFLTQARTPEEDTPSGLSEDSGWRYVPVVGSAYDAYDRFSEGKWIRGTANLALAASDVFLIKSLVTGVGKAAWKGGAKSGVKKYFGIGMSHEYGATVSRLKKIGIDMSGYKHHWLISQETMARYPFLKAIGNQHWNLTKFATQASHMRWAHGQKYLGVGYPKWITKLFYVFSSTPEGFKFGVLPQIIRLAPNEE